MKREDALALLRAHRAKHAPSVTGPHGPAAQAAAFALSHLLPPDLRWHQGADDVLARLAGGGVLAIGLDASAQVNGCATRDGVLRRASITEGFARAVFELAAALWSNPAFLPGVGPSPMGLAPPSPSLPVPRGLEYVAASARARAPAPRQAGDVPLPEWLGCGLASLADARLQAFERTVLHALRFLLLHEVGHVVLGHLDLVASTAGHGAIAEAARRETISPGGPAASTATMSLAARRAFEIEADRHAAITLFEPTQRADGASSPASTALLGASLAMTVFAAGNVFGDISDAALTHPPLWFRLHEIVAAASWSGTAPSVDRLAAPPSLDRSGALIRLLTEVGATHPMLAEWIGPVIDGRHATPVARVLREARNARAAFLRGRPRMRERIVPPEDPR